MLPFLWTDKAQPHGATLLGATGLAVSTLTPHLSHLLHTMEFLTYTFDFLAHFGGAALVVAGWVNFYIAHKKKKAQAPPNPHKVIVP